MTAALGAGVHAELGTFRPHPAERRLADGMTPCRQDEFLLGRLAAQRALARLGADSRPVLQAARAPRFPSGYVGSISHSHGLGVALAVRSPHVRSAGIDVELESLPLGAQRYVCRTVEAEWVGQAEGRMAQRRRLTAIFSAKESVYKALHPLVQQPIRFLDVVLAPVVGGFLATLERDQSSSVLKGAQLAVGVLCTPRLVLSWTFVRQVDR